MPAGFQFVNDSGYTQIDSDFRNLHLVRSKSNMTPGGMSALGTNYSEYALWALIPRGGGGVAANQGYFNDGQRYWNLIYPLPVGDLNYDVYVFDLVTPKSGVTGGVEVYNAAGQLVFSGSDYPMKVYTTHYSQFTYPSNYTVPSGKELAWCVLGGGFRTQDDGVGGGYETWRQYVTLYEGTYIFNPVYESAGGSIIADVGEQDVWGMFIDVTGYPKDYTR